MDLFEIVFLSLFITAITLQSILYSTASPLHSVRPPSVVAFCRQRRNTAVPQPLSNQLTVSSSPIPKYSHHYVTATFTKVVTVAFGSFFFFNSLPNRRDNSGLNKVPHPAGLSLHVAQDMAALCSLAFMRNAAILEVLRSGSMLRSYALMAVGMPAPPNRLPM